MTDATVKSLREGVGILHSALKCICHTLLILLPQKVIFHFLVEKLNYNRISFFSPSTNTLYSSVEYLKKNKVLKQKWPPGVETNHFVRFCEGRKWL